MSLVSGISEEQLCSFLQHYSNHSNGLQRSFHSGYSGIIAERSINVELKSFPHPRSGAATESSRLRRRRSGREGLPHVRGQGQRTRGATARPRSGAAAGRSYPTSEVRGCGREEQPRVQGATAVQAQEGREQLLHVQGQEGRL